MTALLELNNLVVGYPGRPLSSPLTVEIPRGARVGIIGANGSGKSTLVKTLLGLVTPLAGSYHWEQEATFGLVPQEDQISPLFPLTIHDILRMGMRRMKKFEAVATEILQELEILPLKNRLLRELSRGQKQRTLIARALIGKPQVLILDEPYSSLDDLFKEKLWEIFSRRLQGSSFSLIMIEHDLNRVINRVDWVILLAPHGTLAGPRDTVISAEALSRAYGTKVHIHKEEGETQIHFL